jgi:putative protease
MCISYSGRCLLSNYFTGRDANQGACTHPCRWKYAVVEEQRPDIYLPVFENDRGTYIFNSRDLNMIEYIPDLIRAGISSFKIEGRMKSALYVATVTRTYRKAIDDYFHSEQTYRNNMDWYQKEIGRCTYRHFSTGFYFGKPNENNQIYDAATYLNESVYLGCVESVCTARGARIEQKNKFAVGDQIEIMKPSGENIPVTVLAITTIDGASVPDAPHARQILDITLSAPAAPHDILRKNQESSCTN